MNNVLKTYTYRCTDINIHTRAHTLFHTAAITTSTTITNERMSVELSFCRVLTSHFVFDYSPNLECHCRTSAHARARSLACVHVSVKNCLPEPERWVWMFTEMLGIRFYTLVFADKEKRKRNRGEHFEKFTYEALGAAVVLRIDASLLLLFACLLTCWSYRVLYTCAQTNVWKYISTEMSMNSKVIWRMEQDGSHIYKILMLNHFNLEQKWT